MARTVLVNFATKGLKEALRAAKETKKVLLENARQIKDTVARRAELKRIRSEAKNAEIQIKQAIKAKRFAARGSAAAGRNLQLENLRGLGDRLRAGKEAVELGRSVATGSLESVGTLLGRIGGFAGPIGIGAAALAPLVPLVRDLIREEGERLERERIQPLLVEFERRLAELDLERQLQADPELRRRRSRSLGQEVAGADRARARAGLDPLPDSYWLRGPGGPGGLGDL